ncbi:hypothetical protein [Salibacterium halotolerans]|uniref:Uncharacterized protein n=1 Tax=Salibacterium halotolerans TaxID=1884432 RepID=A0A1I5QEH6_9BACI|nr:hypothetical protein [Salibacterium halotolerans]SFP44380.1 hypothetical protein SAMN05518683_105118 [Salibacterium halotolerans]
MKKPMPEFFSEKIQEAKEQFERTIDCKHTEFDDLYPYMNEQPQFFWYKRYVAWQDLLTIVRLAQELDIDWQTEFQNSQVSFIKNKVLDAKVLDEWYGKKRTEA